MVLRRRKSGFGQAADLPMGQLGMPTSRARQLRLSLAWREVAGEAIARRVPALEIRRGVLEIARPDPRWVETLIPLLPKIAARLAHAYPELAVRRFRFREPGQPTEASHEIPPLEPQDHEDSGADPSHSPPAETRNRPGLQSSPADSGQPPSLESLRAAYLQRIEKRKGGQKA